MSFEIKFFDGEFFQESCVDTFDFAATLFEDVYSDENELISRKILAEANGFITHGDVETIFTVADIDADTCTEGYVQFLHYITDEDLNDIPEEFFKVMIIKNLKATTVGKGDGTALLSHLKSYASITDLDHITLIADSKSEVDLNKYYEKVGFLKLPYDNWLYVPKEDERWWYGNKFAQFLENSN
jgi:hypothetical protein